MRLARYTPEAVYIPGRFMVVADALSRGCGQGQDAGDILLENEIGCYTVQELNNINVSERKLSKILNEQRRDPILREVILATLEGWG